MENHNKQIKENYDRFMNIVTQYEARQNRSIKPIIVTKKQPVEIIKTVIQAGAKNLGENYPEQAVSKIDELSDFNETLEWHMIGHLQSRKAKLVCNHFNMLQSLDSVKLAGKLNSTLSDYHRKLKVLIQVNISGEQSKSGFAAWDESHRIELTNSIENIITLENLIVCGLMTMTPLFKDPEQGRPYFVKMRELQDYLGKRFPTDNLSTLSMGTSFDFEIALQEGATMIRVGQSVLGARPKSN